MTMHDQPDRRAVLGLAAAALVPGAAVAQDRRWDAGAPPILIPDPDVLPLDPAFHQLIVPNAVIERVWTGGDWIEGPAWSSGGRFLVFSDVRRDRQYRLLWENGAVSVFREPSGFSNGNLFDHEGRQVICQHLARRVIRVEHDGSVRVLADRAGGQPLNSPNDVAAHPDGSVWFTDPPYGRNLGEGQADAGDGIDGAIGTGLLPIPATGRRRAAAVYRCDPSGAVEQVLGEGEIAMPNGIAFSPDYRTLYVTSTAPRPAAGAMAVHAYPVAGKRLGAGRVLFDMMLGRVALGPDGLKVDRLGNLWCAAAGEAGQTGVLVLSPAGKPLGRIRLPEMCANVSFGGPRRNTLYMAATRSIYALELNVQGAAPS